MTSPIPDLARKRETVLVIAFTVTFVSITTAFGITQAIEAAPIFTARNSPIVAGHVVARTPVEQYLAARADIAIRLDNTGDIVHAHIGRYLLTEIPEVVHFRYSGDPTREVFLFEHEGNPIWVVMFVVCANLVQLGIVRKWLASRA